MLWGYPALYRQFAKEVLPAMQAVDKLRSKPSQVQQQSQDLPRPEGFRPRTNAIPPSILNPLSENVGGQTEDVEAQAPPASGLTSTSEGGRIASRVFLETNLKALSRDQKPASIKSFIDREPISADWEKLDNEGVSESPKNEDLIDVELGDAKVSCTGISMDPVTSLHDPQH